MNPEIKSSQIRDNSIQWVDIKDGTIQLSDLSQEVLDFISDASWSFDWWIY